jgi:hypothetical protein
MKMKKYIIDRFEWENGMKIAYLEGDGGEVLRAHFEVLPENACEGDVLLEDANGYAIDREETLVRRERARKMLEEIIAKSGKNPGH